MSLNNNKFYIRVRKNHRNHPRNGLATLDAALGAAILKTQEAEFKDDLLADLTKRFTFQDQIFNEIRRNISNVRLPVVPSSINHIDTSAVIK